MAKPSKVRNADHNDILFTCKRKAHKGSYTTLITEVIPINFRFLNFYFFATERLIIGNKLSIGGRNALPMPAVQSFFTVQSQGQFYPIRCPR